MAAPPKRARFGLLVPLFAGRGTTWTTTDRCDGTLTKVTRGSVIVRDLRRRKNIALRQGKSYLAKARR